MGIQMEASTTAVTAGSTERPFAKVFAFMWYSTPTPIRYRYNPTQELYSLKLFQYHFEIRIIAGI